LECRSDLDCASSSCVNEACTQPRLSHGWNKNPHNE
jgi:hypothetical protein